MWIKGNKCSFHLLYLTTFCVNHKLVKIVNLKRCCLGFYTLYIDASLFSNFCLWNSMIISFAFLQISISQLVLIELECYNSVKSWFIKFSESYNEIHLRNRIFILWFTLVIQWAKKICSYFSSSIFLPFSDTRFRLYP